jgi:hypothetical protein
MDKDVGDYKWNESAGASCVSGGSHIDYMKDMTLRDWFAGQVIGTAIETTHHPFTESDCETKARWAYRLADALLEERKSHFYGDVKVESNLENANDYENKKRVHPRYFDKKEIK